MKLIRSIVIVLLFIISVFSCTISAQLNNFTTDEFKRIATALNEHDFLADQDSLNGLLFVQYARIIEDFKKKEILSNQKELFYKDFITSQTSKWYNTFWFGSVSSFSLFLLIYFIAK